MTVRWEGTGIHMKEGSVNKKTEILIVEDEREIVGKSAYSSDRGRLFGVRGREPEDGGGDIGGERRRPDPP